MRSGRDIDIVPPQQKIASFTVAVAKLNASTGRNFLAPQVPLQTNPDIARPKELNAQSSQLPPMELRIELSKTRSLQCI